MSARCCPPASARCDSLLRALDRARREDPAAARLRLHFFGTSNQSASEPFRVLPIARECGVEDAVTEVPGRLDYLDALSVLTQASAILLLGSSERHYTASKLYPALLARRPILALFHEASSVVSILRSTDPSQRCASSRTATERRSTAGSATSPATCARSRRARSTIQSDVSLDRAGRFSARVWRAGSPAVFDRVAA